MSKEERNEALEILNDLMESIRKLCPAHDDLLSYRRAEDYKWKLLDDVQK